MLENKDGPTRYETNPKQLHFVPNPDGCRHAAISLMAVVVVALLVLVTASAGYLSRRVYDSSYDRTHSFHYLSLQRDWSKVYSVEGDDVQRVDGADIIEFFSLSGSFEVTSDINSYLLYSPVALLGIVVLVCIVWFAPPDPEDPNDKVLDAHPVD